MKRSSIVMLALAALAVAGCTKQGVMPVRGPMDPPPTPRIAVLGWVDRDGTVHDFPGWVEVREDSLRFVDPGSPARGLERDRPGSVVTVHRDSVSEIRTSHTDVMATAWLVVLIAAITAGAVVLAAAASFANEPLL